MPRPRSPNRDKALQLWLDSGRKRQLKDIAAELQVSEEQIRKWKNQDKWDKVTLPNAKGNVTNHKGAPVGNQNAVGHGAPKQNKNAEKYGFFSKYLPEETVSIIQEMPTDPLDILWDQVQIAYAAIIRAQSIMYVRDQKDVTITKIGHKDGETVTEERWEVQQAWDKQGNFLQAQARAQKTLEGLIKQYDELLHKNWELASEEQKARIAQLRAQTDKLTGNNQELEDMEEIVKFHISEVGPASARKIYADMRRKLGLLAEFPLMGQTHPDPVLAQAGYRKLVLTRTYVAVSYTHLTLPTN